MVVHHAVVVLFIGMLMAPLPTVPSTYDPAGPDQDCGDFPEDEKPFRLPPGDTDPHGLDADDNGIACEGGDASLAPETSTARASGRRGAESEPPVSPSADGGASTPGAYNPSGPDQNCDDFAESEKPFPLPPGDTDPHNLDADDDGIACEGEGDVVEAPQVRHVPRGGVQTGAGGTAPR